MILKRAGQLHGLNFVKIGLLTKDVSSGGLGNSDRDRVASCVVASLAPLLTPSFVPTSFMCVDSLLHGFFFV